VEFQVLKLNCRVFCREINKKVCNIIKGGHQVKKLLASASTKDSCEKGKFLIVEFQTVNCEVSCQEIELTTLCPPSLINELTWSKQGTRLHSFFLSTSLLETPQLEVYICFFSNLINGICKIIILNVKIMLPAQIF
jgi:hypothetical protein